MSSATIRVLTLNAHQGFGAHRRGKCFEAARRASDFWSRLGFLQEIGVAGGSQNGHINMRSWPTGYGRSTPRA
jgi:hypothetical protein